MIILGEIMIWFHLIELEFEANAQFLQEKYTSKKVFVVCDKTEEAITDKSYF